MAGTVVADTLQADSTSTLVLKNGVANTPPTIQDSAGTQIGTFCRAWVNFNGSTVTNPASMTGVRGSFNVLSILDNGVGDYTVNFTTAMPDINYAVVANTRTNGVVMFPADISSGSSVNIQTKISSTLALTDYSTVNVAIFR